MRGFCAVEQDNKERFLPCPQSRWPPAKTSQQKGIFKNRSKECILAVSHGEKFHRKDGLLPRPRVWTVGVLCNAIRLDWGHADMSVWVRQSIEGM